MRVLGAWSSPSCSSSSAVSFEFRRRVIRIIRACARSSVSPLHFVASVAVFFHPFIYSTTAGCCALKIVVEAFSTGPSDDSAPPSHLRYWQYRSLQSCQSHFSGLQTRECLARRLHTTLTSTHTPSSTRRHLRLRHVLRYTTIMALPRSLVASCAAPYPQQP